MSVKWLAKLSDIDLKDLCKEIVELKWWEFDRHLWDFEVDRKPHAYEIQGDVWEEWEGESITTHVHYYLTDFLVDVGDTVYLKDDKQATETYRQFMTEKFGEEYAKECRRRGAENDSIFEKRTE